MVLEHLMTDPGERSRELELESWIRRVHARYTYQDSRL